MQHIAPEHAGRCLAGVRVRDKDELMKCGSASVAEVASASALQLDILVIVHLLTSDGFARELNSKSCYKRYTKR
jgi:hypothetical protein